MMITVHVPQKAQINAAVQLSSITLRHMPKGLQTLQQTSLHFHTGIYEQEFCSVVKKNRLMKFSGKLVDLENVRLNKVIQAIKRHTSWSPLGADPSYGFLECVLKFQCPQGPERQVPFEGRQVEASREEETVEHIEYESRKGQYWE